MTTPLPETTSPDTTTADPFGWLEDIDSERSLAWVTDRNRHAAATLASTPRFRAIENGIREVLDSSDKIPVVAKIGEHFYNFWTDSAHERGIWRKTTLDSYLSDAPHWETVLDIDELNRREGQDWVWHGARALRGHLETVLIDLSHGGADADVTREFSLVSHTFVDPADGGFFRDEAKGSLTWIDRDTVYVMTDTGPGSLTTSGYPRTVKRWRRGQPLSDATTVFEGQSNDIAVSAHRSHEPGFERDVLRRAITFYTNETYLDRAGDWIKLDVPDSAETGLRGRWLLVELRDDWTVPDGPATVTYPAGSLLAIDLERFLAGSRTFTALFTPTATTSLAGATWTRGHLVLNVMDNVTTRLMVLTPAQADGDVPDGQAWPEQPLPGVADLGTSSIAGIDAVETDDAWVFTTGFLTPTTMSRVTVGSGGAPQPVKSAPAHFSTAGLRVSQNFATSADGTTVPYFVVARDDLPDDATTPTLLYGYGGFEISLTPTYSGSLGRSWLERGGAYALANIRGGGEFGPAWHQSAVREGRRRAYQDFAAVAQDLAARGIADAAHLGIQGGSNGGLLTGNMLTQYPELFGAVVVQVPLLDMRRYTKLLAGASWMAEYGDPDVPSDWEFMRLFSPYHLFEPARAYPPVLFTTSTRDDRVHPGHARKMAALMLSADKDVTYYENIEGGHGGAASNAQAAHMAALAYEFLWQRLHDHGTPAGDGTEPA